MVGVFVGIAIRIGEQHIQATGIGQLLDQTRSR